MKNKGPLTQEHETECKAALRKIHDAEQLLLRMEAIGIDTKPLRDALTERRETLEAIRTEFLQ